MRRRPFIWNLDAISPELASAFGGSLNFADDRQFGKGFDDLREASTAVMEETGRALRQAVERHDRLGQDGGEEARRAALEAISQGLGRLYRLRQAVAGLHCRFYGHEGLLNWWGQVREWIETELHYAEPERDRIRGRDGPAAPVRDVGAKAVEYALRDRLLTTQRAVREAMEKTGTARSPAWKPIAAPYAEAMRDYLDYQLAQLPEPTLAALRAKHWEAENPAGGPFGVMLARMRQTCEEVDRYLQLRWPSMGSRSVQAGMLLPRRDSDLQRSLDDMARWMGGEVPELLERMRREGGIHLQTDDGPLGFRGGMVLDAGPAMNAPPQLPLMFVHHSYDTATLEVALHEFGHAVVDWLSSREAEASDYNMSLGAHEIVSIVSPLMTVMMRLAQGEEGPLRPVEWENAHTMLGYIHDRLRCSINALSVEQAFYQYRIEHPGETVWDWETMGRAVANVRIMQRPGGEERWWHYTGFALSDYGPMRQWYYARGALVSVQAAARCLELEDPSEVTGPFMELLSQGREATPEALMQALRAGAGPEHLDRYRADVKAIYGLLARKAQEVVPEHALTRLGQRVAQSGETADRNVRALVDGMLARWTAGPERS